MQFSLIFDPEAVFGALDIIDYEEADFELKKIILMEGVMLLDKQSDHGQ